jgi:hypothetical protein
MHWSLLGDFDRLGLDWGGLKGGHRVGEAAFEEKRKKEIYEKSNR